MKVCEDNNLEILQLFVGYGVDMNSHNALDDTPLMVACEHGYLDMVKYFIEIHCDHGVNINYKSEEVGEARSKLLKEILSQKEDLTMLNYLLRQGFKLTEEDHVIFSEGILDNYYDENYEEFMGRYKYLIEHNITFYIKNDD
jgi:hypothetical protein